MSGRLTDHDIASIVSRPGGPRLARAPGKAEPPKVKRRQKPLTANEQLACAMSEKELQGSVRQMALFHKWRYFHPWNSEHSPEGYPDCTLIRFTRQNTCAGQKIFARLLMIELKREGKSPTPAQQEWLDDFALMGRLIETLMANRRVDALDISVSIESYCWRPADWLSGEVEKVLA